MGKGSSGLSGGGAPATKAVQIENMNEAQIDKEINAAKNAIRAADKVMQENDITGSASAKAMREAFPLGVGSSGWTKERKNARDRSLERDAAKAKKYTDAYEKKQAAEKRLQNLEKTKEKIKGTGKTLKQINDEKAKKAIEDTKSTLKWKTTQKAEHTGSGYKPKIIKAGPLEIHGSNGLYSIYKNGKLVGRTNSLSKAKAAAERLK